MRSFSCHKIYSKYDIGFSPLSYSKFKHGETSIAIQFGEELAHTYWQKHRQDLLNHEVVVIPSPYKSIPTASFFMAQAFIRLINYYFFKAGRKSVLESKMYRHKTYSADYGSLSFEERLSLISDDTYHLDISFLQKKHCLFIDDIKITGSHEKMIRSVIESTNVDGDIWFLYYAELANTDLEPAFENYLNNYGISSIHDLCQVMNSKTFRYNTRVIKYVLSLDSASINVFIRQTNAGQIQELLDWALHNDYHLMTEYTFNLNLLIQHVNYGYQLTERTA